MSDATAGQEAPLPSARDLFDGSNEAILVHDPTDGTVLDANPTAERLYGYETAALCGTRIGTLLVGDREQDTDVTTLAAEEREVRWLVERPDDECRWIGASFEQTASGEYVLSFGRDVTDEQIQREAPDRPEQALDTATDGTAIVDASETIAYANQAYADIHGIEDPDTLLGEHWETVQADGEWAHLSERAVPTVEDRGEWRGETVGETADGDRVEKEVSLKRIEGGSTVAVARDVTDLRAREQELRENAHTLRRLQEIVSDRETDFGTKVTQLLSLGCAWLDLSYGYMTHIDGGVQEVEATVGDHEEITPGGTADISETYCQHTLAAADDEEHVYSVTDVDDSEIADTDAFEKFGLSCYIGGTVTVDDAAYGTVCFADDSARNASFSEMEQTFVDLVAEWIGLELERRQTKQNLRDASSLRENILAASPTGIVVLDADGEISIANERAERLLGTDDLVGSKTLEETLRDETGQPLPEADRPTLRVGRDGETIESEQYAVETGRDSRYVRVAGRPLSSVARASAVLTVEDVTEQRRQTEALQALTDAMATATGTFEQQLSALLDVGRRYLDLANGHLTEIDAEQQRHEVVATRGLESTLRDDTVGDIDETYCRHVLDQEAVWSINDAQETMADDPAFTEWGLPAYIGTVITVEGETSGTLCFADDTARTPFSEWEQTFVRTLGRWVETRLERRQREAAFDRSRSLLEGVFNAPDRLVGITDPEGNLTDANDAALSFLGADPGTYVGEKAWETPWWDTEEAARSCRDGIELAADGEQTTFESVYAPDSQNPTFFEVTIRPVTDDDEVINVVIEGTDVTESQERERELERRQQYIDAILENAPLVLYALDEDGVFRHSRGRGLRSLGIEDQELRGESIYEAFGEQQPVIDDYERARAGENVETVRNVGPAVYRTWYRSADLDGEETVIGLGFDITDQHRQKERIREVSDATESLLYARSPDEVAETVVDIASNVLSYPLAGVWFRDEETGHLEPVAGTEQVLSFVDASSVDAALPSIPPGCHEYDVFEAGETDVVERYDDVDGALSGSRGPESVIVVPLGEYGMLHVGSPEMESPDEVQLDLIRILSRNAQAALTATTREEELEASKQELERSNEALQQFAYIASHDLQEPLRMVSSYVDLLEMEYGDEFDEEAREYMDFAVDGADRMQSMIDGLLEYSRVSTDAEPPEPIDPTETLDSTARELSLFLDDHDATVDYDTLPNVAADSHQIGQVFQNLIKNAVEHGGASTVSVSAQRDGAYVEFAVTDNGSGIPSDQHGKIFEIFTKGTDNGSGTGIGLAVCRRIVHRHDGDIWVDSAPGDGTTFFFTLPHQREYRDD